MIRYKNINGKSHGIKQLLDSMKSEKEAPKQSQSFLSKILTYLTQSISPFS